MPPLTLTYLTDALRCLTICGGLSVCAVSGSENCPPHATDGKGLKTDEIGARVAGNQKARPVSRLRGADVPFRACCFPTGNEIKSL